MYTNDNFLLMRDETTQSRFEMSDAKAQAYTRGSGDRLNNFKTLANRYGISARDVLAVYMGKHIMALEHWLATGEESSEGIESTLDDIQNYADLARAMYRESILTNIK